MKRMLCASPSAAAAWLMVAPSLLMAQVALSASPPYCSDLKRVVALASGSSRFKPIAGNPREGNYTSTTLSLPGWSDCVLYGERTYSCDSKVVPTADAARAEQRKVLSELSVCLGEDWAEDASRSTPVYVIVHQRGTRVSLTLSTDQNERDEHVVRLILFLR